MNIISKVRKYLIKNGKALALKIGAVIVAMAIAVCVTLCWSGISSQARYTELEQQYNSQIVALDNTVKSMTTKNAELQATIKEQKSKLNELTVQCQELTEKVDTLTNEKAELEQDLEDTKAELAARKSSTSTSRNQSSSSVSDVSSSDLDMEYPDSNYTQATYIWNHLRSLGLNEYVCAGIMGNIMSEVGGHTLDLSLYSCTESESYYGICQWSGDRKARLLNEYGRSVEAQAKFLGVELFEVIPSDSEFYDMTSETDAALYFAKHFERCASWTYSVRQEDATKALNYFT